ncbi:MAG: hypothetical protein U1F68_02885 [Gammaproteobacteria bacterium]
MTAKTTSFHTHVRFVPGGVWIRFYDFLTASATPRDEHRAWIDEVVVPFLKESPARSVFVVGIASSASGIGEDKGRALRRVQAVCAYLKKQGISEAQYEKGFGPFRAVTEEPVVDDTLRKNDPARAALMEKPGYYRAVEVWLIKHNVARMVQESDQLAQRHADERAAINQ